MNKTEVVAFSIFGMFYILYYVAMPMFNAYLEYKLNLKQMESIPNEPIPELYREVKDEERLQRDNADSDSSKGVGKSSKRILLHDEELPL